MGFYQIDVFLQIFVMASPQVYNEFKEYEKKNPTSKYIRSWNLRSKLDLAITFWVVLLMISYEDPIWYSIVGYLKKSNSGRHEKKDSI